MSRRTHDKSVASILPLAAGTVVLSSSKQTNRWRAAAITTGLSFCNQLYFSVFAHLVPSWFHFIINISSVFYLGTWFHFIIIQCQLGFFLGAWIHWRWRSSESSNWEGQFWGELYSALRRRGERWPLRKDSPPTDCCVFSFRWSLPLSHIVSKGLLAAISNQMCVSGWVDRDTDVKVNLQNFLLDPEGHIKPSDFRLVLVQNLNTSAESDVFSHIQN